MCYIKTLTQSNAYKDIIIAETSNLLQNVSTGKTFHVELRLSCTSTFGISEEGYEVACIFICYHANIFINIRYNLKKKTNRCRIYHSWIWDKSVKKAQNGVMSFLHWAIEIMTYIHVEKNMRVWCNRTGYTYQINYLNEEKRVWCAMFCWYQITL